LGWSVYRDPTGPFILTLNHVSGPIIVTLDS